MRQFIKSAIAATPIFTLLKTAIRHYQVLVGKSHPIQVKIPSQKYPTLYLGTQYGGWTFVDDPSLYNSVIISAGLGEDASFDIEFAARYKSMVIIVDPTPRAITHFNEIIRNIGKKREIDYSDCGKEDPRSYDLSHIDPSQLVLVEKALWNEQKIVKFYEPKHKSHVSHSIINYQHGYSKNTDFIEVQSDTLSNIVEEQGIDFSEVSLIKLDIEGAEIEVITQMLDYGCLPKQILVEFDELNTPSRTAVERVDRVHSLLLSSGYKLIHTNGKADFLYYKVRGQ